MDDEFDLHANLDSEPLMVDTPTSAPATSFYKSTTFKVLMAVLIVIAVVFVVSYFWGSKTPPPVLPIAPPSNWPGGTPVPTPSVIPKTEHEKLVKTIPKNELYEVMKATDSAQQERKRGLLTQYKSISDLDISTMTPDKASIILSAKGIYEKMAQEASYIPSKNDTQVLQYCMRLTAPTPKTVTIDPVPTVCDTDACAPPKKADEDEDDNSIVEIGKKSPLDALDQ